MPRKRLLVECADSRGLVAKITEALMAADQNILSNHEFVDEEQQRFFMRTEIEGPELRDEFVTHLKDTLPKAALVTVRSQLVKKIVIFAGKESHCLGDLLMKAEFELPQAKIVAVISNHDALEDLTKRFNLPFHHVPVEGDSREQHEQNVLEILQTLDFDFLVLAKYMRILSSDFVKRFTHRMINIHHSFLPAFIGARPYHQAYERGVKMIGATAHFVTDDLDDGPIIAQNVQHVSHGHTAQDLAHAGRDVEKLTLSQALGYVLEDRVFVNGRRTVVFAT